VPGNNWVPDTCLLAFLPTAAVGGDVPIPDAVTAFPGESFVAPRSWAEKAYPKLVYFHQAEAGGHCAAWEQLAIFSREVRDAFRTLRG
jgi:hypothetical protein